MPTTAGPLALVGGDEFHPGNEQQDELLRDAAAGRPAYVIATAARTHPEAAVTTARAWFSTLGVDINELRVHGLADAKSPPIAELAARAGLFYITGGDPGRVAQILRGSAVWGAVQRAWRDGAALAGSSAGAMVLCRWTLVRKGWPGHTERRPIDALGVLPDCAFLPHYDTFGEAWIPSAQDALGPDTLLIGVDERSAAVWRDGEWTAMGPGRVTVIAGSHRSEFRAGERVEGLPQPRRGRDSAA